MDKQDVIKDYGIFTTAGRKDWKLMLESRKKADQKVKDLKAVKKGLGHNTDARPKVVPPKIGQGKKDVPRVKDGKIEEEGTPSTGIPGGVAAAAGPGTTTAAIASVPAKLGQKPKDMFKKNEEVVTVGAVEEVPGQESAETVSSPKIDSIEKKRAKLEQQMVELEEEKLRVIKLSQLATQKAELQEQLAAIKEEMANVKSGKGETEEVGGILSAEENAEHETDETPAEEKEESEEDDSDDAEEIEAKDSDDSDDKKENSDDK